MKHTAIGPQGTVTRDMTPEEIAEREAERNAPAALEEMRAALLAEIDRRALEAWREHRVGLVDPLEDRATLEEARAIAGGETPNPKAHIYLEAERQARAAAGEQTTLELIAREVVAAAERLRKAGAKIKKRRREAKLFALQATTAEELDSIAERIRG